MHKSLNTSVAPLIKAITPISNLSTGSRVLYVDLYGGDNNNDGTTWKKALRTLNGALSKTTFYAGSCSWRIWVFTTEKPKNGAMNCVYTVEEDIYVVNKIITFYGATAYEVTGNEAYSEYDRPAIIFNAAYIRATNYASIGFEFMNISFKNVNSDGGIRVGLYSRMGFSSCNIGFDNCVNCINIRDSGYCQIHTSCSLFIDKCTGSPIYATIHGTVIIAIEEESSIDINATGTSTLISASWGANVIVYRLKGTVRSSTKAIAISRGTLCRVGAMQVTNYSTANAQNTYAVSTGARLFIGNP